MVTLPSAANEPTKAALQLHREGQYIFSHDISQSEPRRPVVTTFADTRSLGTPSLARGGTDTGANLRRTVDQTVHVPRERALRFLEERATRLEHST